MRRGGAAGGRCYHPAVTTRLDRLERGWPRRAFWLSLGVLGLAALGLTRLGLLPALVAAIAASTLMGFRARSLWARLLGVEAAITFAVAAVVVYGIGVGEEITVNLSLPLSAVLLLGTIAYGAHLETEPGWPQASDGGAIAASLWARLRWDRALSFVVVVCVLTLAVSAWAFGPSPSAVTYTWLVAVSTFWPVMLLSLACLWPGRVGVATTASALVALEVAMVWYIASTEVVLAQAHRLLWREMRLRLSEPGGWATLAEGLLSVPSALLVLVIFGAFPVLGRAARRLHRSNARWLWARLLAGATTYGGLLAQSPVLDPHLHEGYWEAARAPWFPFEPAPPTTGRLDAHAAVALRARPEPPIWAPGPAEPLARLAGRYVGRSVMLVIMESHGARDVEVLGGGAYEHRPCSPQLSRLAREGLLFENYFAAGFASVTALWTIFSGLPLPLHGTSGEAHLPEATPLGPLHAFRRLGHEVQALWGASSQFGNWDRALSAAGGRWSIDPAETRDLPREYVTSWGMPDENLFTLGLRRYRQAAAARRPTLLILWTCSNHPPFRLPAQVDGVPLPRDNRGGMRYADHQLGRLVDEVRRLPEPQRPVLFVVADHSHLVGLREAEPAGILSPEGLRVPGLLLLPDGYAAGRRFDGVFAHEDVLDLMALLVSARPPGPRFVETHREVAFFNGEAAVSQRAIYSARRQRFYRLATPWRIEGQPAAAETALLQAAWRRYEAQNGRLWPPEPRSLATAAAGHR